MSTCRKQDCKPFLKIKVKKSIVHKTCIKKKSSLIWKRGRNMSCKRNNIENEIRSYSFCCSNVNNLKVGARRRTLILQWAGLNITAKNLKDVLKVLQNKIRDFFGFYTFIRSFKFSFTISSVFLINSRSTSS
jgi:hypothetical protein